MTVHATHRFSVGQLVFCAGNAPGGGCTVTAQIVGQEGPAYEVVFSDGRQHKVVPERELTYGDGVESSGSAAGSVGAELPSRVVHSCPWI